MPTRGPRRPIASISPAGLAALLAVAALAALVHWLPRLGAARVLAGPGHVEVWGWNIAGEALGLLKPRFEAAHPDTSIDLKVVGTAMQSRFLLAMASGSGGPDIMQFQEREVGKYTPTARLADLSPWAARYARDFAPSFWSSCIFDGKVYAIPWDIAPCAVFYKRPVFAKFGIDPDAIETWDDLIAAGQRIKAASNGMVRMMPLGANALGAFFQMLMQQAGGGVFDADGRVIFDSPQNRVALATIRRLLDSGTCTPISLQTELNAAYNDRSVACFPGPSWFIGNIRDAATSTSGEWGVFRLPALAPGGLRNSNQGGSVLCIPGSSGERDRASAFVECALCTVEGQLEQFRKKGLIPAYLPALRDPGFDEADPFFAGQHVARLLVQDFDRVPPLVRTRDWDEAERFIGARLYDWARERQDDAAWTKDVAERLAARLGREQAR